MAPGTLGVNGGREEGSMDGWMNGGVHRQVKHIASQVYLSRCYGGITKRKIEEIKRRRVFFTNCPTGLRDIEGVN